jgi:hypothetical protein
MFHFDIDNLQAKESGHWVFIEEVDVSKDALYLVLCK